MRTSGQGFGVIDKVRQRYAMTERDDATGLDHTWWRKYENRSGRWTSSDPYNGSVTTAEPQSFNRYSYTGNDPVNLVDPTGLRYVLVEHKWCVDDYVSPMTCESTYDWVWVDDGPGGGGGGGGAGTGGGLHEGGHNPQTTKPATSCPPVPLAPPDANIIGNMMRAEQHQPKGLLTGAYGADWFKNMVQAKGSTAEKVRRGDSWNYKKLGSKYEEFGNFNFGATGAAIGFDLATLQIEAGRAQIAAGLRGQDGGLRAAECGVSLCGHTVMTLMTRI